jgi:hypothetical protein
MQLQLAHFCQFLLDSYLRIKEEYWVGGRGLGEEMGRLKKKRCQGLAKLIGILRRREAERERESLIMEGQYVLERLKNEGATVEEEEDLVAVVRLEERMDELEDEKLKEQEGIDQLQAKMGSLGMHASDERSWLYDVD